MRYSFVKEKVGTTLNFCIKDNMEDKIIYRSLNKVQVLSIIDDLNKQQVS